MRPMCIRLQPERDIRTLETFSYILIGSFVEKFTLNR